MDTVPCHATPFECRRSSRCHLEIARIRLTRERWVKLEYHIQSKLIFGRLSQRDVLSYIQLFIISVLLDDVDQ